MTRSYKICNFGYNLNFDRNHEPSTSSCLMLVGHLRAKATKIHYVQGLHIWPLVSSWPGSPLLGCPWVIHAAAGGRLSFERCHEGLDETRDPKANDITASVGRKKKHAISV